MRAAYSMCGVVVGLVVAVAGCGKTAAPAAKSSPKTPTAVQPSVTPAMPVEHDGLTVLEARWGSGNEQSDVRALLEGRIKDGRVDLQADGDVLGNPAPSKKKQLMVTYDVHGQQRTQWFAEGTQVSFGVPKAAAASPPQSLSTPPTPPAPPTPLAPPQAAQAPVAAPIAQGPVDHGGFKLLDAKWGNSQADVRPILEALVKDNRLEFLIERGMFGADPNGNAQRLRLTFEVNGKQFTEMIGEGDRVSVGVDKPGLHIKRARWGLGSTSVEVSEKIESLMRGNTLSFDLTPEVLGADPLPQYRQKTLVLRYTLDGKDVTARFTQGSHVLIASEREIAAAATGAPESAPPLVPVTVSLFDGMVSSGAMETQMTPAGLTMHPRARDGGKIEMPQEFQVPVTLTARVQTDNNNIRLLFGDKGVLIFDWEANLTELRFHDPKSGANNGVPGKGMIPPKTWATVRWRIDANESHIDVDGVERAVFKGDFRGMRGKAAIATSSDSTLTVSAFDVATMQPAVVPVPPGPLTIVSALWGDDTRRIDVAPKLRLMVADDRLQFKAESRLLTDPTPGSPKDLLITYDFNGERRTQSFKEDAPLELGGPTPAWARRAAAARQADPKRLVVVEARWGRDVTWKDVTDACDALVSAESLTVIVSGAAFNDREGDWSTLHLKYLDGDRLKSISAPNGSVIQLGKKTTSFLKLGEGVKSLEKAIADGRRLRPTGLIVLDARWGGFDVSDICQKAASGDSMTIRAHGTWLGKPDDQGNLLTVLYSDATGVKTVTAKHDEILQIGPKVTTFTQLSGTLGIVDDALPKSRAAHGDGLSILSARFGIGGSWEDVGDLLQKKIVADRLVVTVGDGWKHPLQGADERLELTYWDGEKVVTCMVKNEQRLDLTGILPAEMKSLGKLPAFVAEGKPVTFAFGTRGRYTLRQGPEGATLAADGRLSWTPRADQVGVNTFQFAVMVGSRQFQQLQSLEVVSANLAATAGDPAKLEKLMRFDLAGEKHTYLANQNMKGGLILEPGALSVVGPDGMSVVRRLPLAKEYLQVGERSTYFVAVRQKPAAIDLLDKITGKVTKTIRLDYRTVYDLALAPDRPVSYVGAELADTIPRGRIVIVDETSGEVREPKGFLGNYIAMDRSGREMWVGLHDIYRNGSQFFINPGFNIVDVPTYGDVDFLLHYGLSADGPQIKQHRNNVGANGGRVRVSPDGKRVTFLSFTGFPAFSKNIAAWDSRDFEKKPVVYDIKDDTEGKGATDLDFHPILPLVVIPKEDGVIVFGRDSGEKEPDRVKISPGVLEGVVVKNARFSPDGLTVILDCKKGETWFFYKVPLTLSAEEKATVRKGPASEPVTPPPPQNLHPPLQKA